MNLSFKKRGSSVIDMIFIVFVLLTLGVGFFFVKHGWDGINEDLLADDDLDATSKAMLSDNNNNFTKWGDASFGFVFFGLLIGVLITSFLIDSHPLFFVISIILFVFVIFIGAVMTNVFEDTVADDDLSGLQDDFPIMMFIMNNLVKLLVVTFALMCIVLYGKGNSGVAGQ